jgi:FkbM family methyltransferase
VDINFFVGRKYAQMLKKLKKLLVLILLFDHKVIRALFHGVAAGVEHRNFLLNNKFNTILDIGANRGQFALIARSYLPSAKILSFEPLRFPYLKFTEIFKHDKNIAIHNFAIGPSFSEMEMHISEKDDSSSLLPITNLQTKIFPGTAEIFTQRVLVRPLDQSIKHAELIGKTLLKIDVQGFEWNVLLGSEKLFNKIDDIYCECSFLELYGNQKLASDVIDFLGQKNFLLAGLYNLCFDNSGNPIQADFHFKKKLPQ